MNQTDYGTSLKQTGIDQAPHLISSKSIVLETGRQIDQVDEIVHENHPAMAASYVNLTAAATPKTQSKTNSLICLHHDDRLASQSSSPARFSHFKSAHKIEADRFSIAEFNPGKEPDIRTSRAKKSDSLFALLGSFAVTDQRRSDFYITENRK